mmetsp:Transcript_2519/g.2562  ORF Transcript_2519/g.2562 Transcript_2519/m.2562 type:complete len:86 (-) Transcript_2519:168-425(-)
MRGHHIMFYLEQWRFGFAKQSQCKCEKDGYMGPNGSSNLDLDEEPQPSTLSTGTNPLVQERLGVLSSKSGVVRYLLNRILSVLVD